MNKKTITDYLYIILSQLSTIVIPILLMPYKARTLGPENIGIYGFVFANYQYLAFISTLGISWYGRREIASLKGNKEKQTKILYELILLRLIITVISSIIFYLVIGFNSKYSLYYLFLIPSILFSIFDLTWFYQGIEKFKKISIINTICNILVAIAILVFIKSPKDLNKYFIVTILFNIFPIVLLNIGTHKYLTKIKLNELKIKKHLKSCLLIFIPQIFINLYTMFDKVMVGVFCKIENVGFYDYSEKIVVLSLSLVSAISLIIIPKISLENKKVNKKQIKNYINKAITFGLLAGIPITLGIYGVSNNLVNIFFGKDYLKMINLIKILSISIIPIIITSIIGEGYLISTKQEKKFTIIIFIGAITNILLNYILLQKIDVFGAAIATIITEILVLIIELPIILNLIDKKQIISKLTKYLVYGIIMYIGVYLIGKLGTNIYILIGQIIAGMLLYLTTMFITRDEYLFMVLNKLKEKTGK